MAIRHIVETERESYLARMPEVSALFSIVFRRPFPAEAWEHWYCRNPYGPPVVAMAYADGELIGHNALIPQRFETAGGRHYSYMQSISTMVDRRFRDLSVFKRLVSDVHAEALSRGVDLVVGFPNVKSLVPFRALFGYRTLFETPLCEWDVTDSVRPESPLSSVAQDEPADAYTYPADPAYWNWRTAVNGAQVASLGDGVEVVYKEADALVTILDVRVPAPSTRADALREFARSRDARQVRITAHHAGKLGIPSENLKPHEGYVVRLTACPLSNQAIPTIRFSLLLSDIF